MNILKVSEKNCYPCKNGGCQHVCIVKEDKNKIKSIILDSSKIYNILGKDSPIHIKQTLFPTFS